MVLEECILVVGPGLSFAPVTVENVLARVDEAPSVRNCAPVDGVRGHGNQYALRLSDSYRCTDDICGAERIPRPHGSDAQPQGARPDPGRAPYKSVGGRDPARELPHPGPAGPLLRTHRDRHGREAGA